MIVYAVLLALHVLGATIWTGGHLVLALTVLPRVLRQRSVRILLDFEGAYERIGIPALIVQVLTGLWLAYLRLGPPRAWFDHNPLAHVVQAKLGLLVLTAALTAHARVHLIPKLTEEKLPVLAWHIGAVTVLSVLFVLAGVAFRMGGIG